MAEHDIVEVDGKPVSLAQLAGLDLSDIEELRQFTCPKGIFVFEISRDDTGKPPGLRAGKGKAYAMIPCKIIEVVAVTDPEWTQPPVELVGKIHHELQFLTTEKSA